MKRSLSNQGFLAPEISGVIQQVHTVHSELFVFCERLNELAHRSLFSAKVNRNNLRELVLSTLVHKAMTAYQGAIVVAERGMHSEARILLRTLLEVTFKAVAIAKNPDAVREYVGENVFQQRRLIRNFKKLSPELRGSSDSYELDQAEAALTAQITAEGIVERKTFWYAEQAAMEDFYRSAYSLLSETVHVSVGQLESLLNVDAKGVLSGLKYGPSDAGIEHNLLTGAEALLFTLMAAYSAVDVPTAEEIHAMHNEFNELHSRYSIST